MAGGEEVRGSAEFPAANDRLEDSCMVLDSSSKLRNGVTVNRKFPSLSSKDCEGKIHTALKFETNRDNSWLMHRNNPKNSTLDFSSARVASRWACSGRFADSRTRIPFHSTAKNRRGIYTRGSSGPSCRACRESVRAIAFAFKYLFGPLLLRALRPLVPRESTS